MLHTTNPVIKHKTGLLNLDEELSNVSKACKIMSVSRDTFYRYRKLADEGGVDALISYNRRAPTLKIAQMLQQNRLLLITLLHSLLTVSTGPATSYVNKRLYLRKWCSLHLVAPQP